VSEQRKKHRRRLTAGLMKTASSSSSLKPTGSVSIATMLLSLNRFVNASTSFRAGREDRVAGCLCPSSSPESSLYSAGYVIRKVNDI